MCLTTLLKRNVFNRNGGCARSFYGGKFVADIVDKLKFQELLWVKSLSYHWGLLMLVVVVAVEKPASQELQREDPLRGFILSYRYIISLSER
jgi:hypothetical protein